MCCYQSQNYKNWKQFTTCAVACSYIKMLLSIAKLQNLKAIHNHTLTLNLKRKVVINRRTTKFESKSQRYSPYEEGYIGCYQSQNYKIWKQFTTKCPTTLLVQMLLSITKLQNLKSIHNAMPFYTEYPRVVINHKTIKFEINSQLKRPIKVM